MRLQKKYNQRDHRKVNLKILIRHKYTPPTKAVMVMDAAVVVMVAAVVEMVAAVVVMVAVRRWW